MDEQRIAAVVQRWALYRDAGDWDRFAELWHPDGWMSATWFQGPYEEFIRASRKAFADGVRILHFLGGTAADVAGSRAVAQTKMTITQRGVVHDTEVDVVCTGRFYDFFALHEGDWRITHRQPIYETDRMDPVDPSAVLSLDPGRLNRFPVGYRHLAYLQEANGQQVRPGLPGLADEATTRLYREGRAWLLNAV
ncbi:nuclear transport factor 2 family protein [Kutzneria sp. CA-103260]|uniref:nuclear transport factor 2 family protein n=1 Tax=Kutzneria sp. CA-103260 TaxID=2802641 RepID=UPI001BABF27A|nr:nuclear transport factor 2 family protein [Kutzneria sp. CA-103260]QUQ68537.1 SnoaL-like domain protein [Kutzneria sp. CA-103260]